MSNIGAVHGRAGNSFEATRSRLAFGRASSTAGHETDFGGHHPVRQIGPGPRTRSNGVRPGHDWPIWAESGATSAESSLRFVHAVRSWPTSAELCPDLAGCCASLAAWVQSCRSSTEVGASKKVNIGPILPNSTKLEGTRAISAKCRRSRQICACPSTLTIWHGFVCTPGGPITFRGVCRHRAVQKATFERGLVEPSRRACGRWPGWPGFWRISACVAEICVGFVPQRRWSNIA